jgi:asparagine synthase (glutamine-hydrolysing)
VPEDAPRWLHAAAAALRHRGPDDRGVWREHGVGFAHTRLSILDLSPLGHQPMVSRDGRWVMVYNGEVYNFREIRCTLESLGRTFRGSGDSEVILEAFAEWGPGAVRRFVGMFALALWDRSARRLYLVRDRLGVKPLYYGWNGKALWFGSELKALRAFRHWPVNLDRAATADYFRYGYIAEPRSIYQGVSKLPAAHWLVLGPEGGPAIVRYWSVLDAARRQRAASEAALAEELEALMVSAFRYRMIADVPVGVFFSGGIDSSTLAAILQRHAGQKIRTFTIGFREAAFDESRHAERVARHLGTEHTTRILEAGEALRLLPQWGDLYDEPFGDDSGIPTLLVSRVAAESVKVVLSADGGDELFSGYNGYTHVLRRWRQLASLPGWLRSAAAAALRPLPLERAARIRERLRARTLGGLYDLGLAIWQRDELARLLGGEAHARRASCDLYPGLDGEKLCLWDLHYYLPGDILAKVDRATMAASIEGREPLLDHRLVEFAFSLPFRLRRGAGGPKHLLRKVLHRYVPRELVERPKQGFAIPVRAWLAGDLRERLEHHLASSTLAAQGLFEPAAVRRLRRAFDAGDRLAEQKLWLLFAFQMWHARWMTGRAPGADSICESTRLSAVL